MPKEKATYNAEDLQAVLEDQRNCARVTVRVLTPIAGGVPAKEDGLKAFIEHHLGISPVDAELFNATLARIQKEEIGERDVKTEVGELEMQEVYSVNQLRRSDLGPFLAAHQLNAAIKQSASRLRIFQKKRGSKGDVAEMGTVLAAGDSLQNPDRPWEIYLRKNGGPAATSFEKISGSVSSPQGRKSIQHHSEVVEEGAVFVFDFHWTPFKFTNDHMVKTVAGMNAIGQGSCLSLGYGRIEVEQLEFIK